MKKEYFRGEGNLGAKPGSREVPLIISQLGVPLYQGYRAPLRRLPTMAGDDLDLHKAPTDVPETVDERR